MSKHMEQLRAARRAAVPIIMIRAADYSAVIKEVDDFFTKDKEVPLLKWDICRGVLGINKSGTEAARKVNDPEDGGSPKPPAIATGNPVDALRKAASKLPPDAILFMQNIHIIIESREPNRIGVIQAIWNCRDLFKSDKRVLVLLCPDMKLPPELSNDVVTIDVALPTVEELKEVVVKIFKAGNVELPPDEVMSKAVDAVSGLSSFSAEQVTAMSLTPTGVNTSDMWERKKAIIRQTGGLNVHDKNASFDALGGLQNIKSYLRQIIKGKRRPKLVVLIDEIEKQMGGLGDSSGVGMDAFGVILSSMQDNGWSGVLFPGFPGSGKTECGKAMGAESDGLFLTLDLGGMKDKFVGNSEKMVRAAMSMLLAMGGPNVFFIGTCNSMATLKPELKRRFSKGTFFFDLPSDEEQKAIWPIYFKKCSLTEQPLPECFGWTGMEIRACCELADELGISLTEAANYITPVIKSMGDDGVSALRSSAHNKYLSAAAAGFYSMTNAETDTGIHNIRKIGE